MKTSNRNQKTSQSPTRREFLTKSCVALSGAAIGFKAPRLIAGDSTPAGNISKISANSDAKKDPGKEVYVVPNFHPASCGWLTNFSRERNYCANSYLDHLDRVASDSSYAFVMSEVNNMIAVLNFQPLRFEELKRRIQEGRVEAVNAFFLEPTICLSGGEALVKQGVEGLRWQQAMLGLKPRNCWMIDATGMHEQMPQIVAGLGLETLVHCRNNPTGSAVYWGQSPDGTRTLTVSSGHYNIWTSLFRTEELLSSVELEKLIEQVRSRRHSCSASRVKEVITPEGIPFLVLAGSGDYSLAPRNTSYPRKFLEQWKKAAPDLPLRFSTFSDYVDRMTPPIHSKQVELPTGSSGWDYSYLAFWIQNPKVKQKYRFSEHTLQATEMLATTASLKTDLSYPTQELYCAWLQMLLNMDRNSLWGAAGGMVFEHPTSWDVQDRFNWVNSHCTGITQQAVRKLGQSGNAITLFNPNNWRRNDPIALSLDENVDLKDTTTQQLPDGRTLCQIEQQSLSLMSIVGRRGNAKKTPTIPLPDTIETDFYTANVDPQSGDLISLKLKVSGREILAGPANFLVSEAPESRVSPGNHMLNRPQRKRLAVSNSHFTNLSVTKGPLATQVDVRSQFYGDKLARRVITFHHHYPRIDFDTYLEDLPDQTVVVAEFPLADSVTEIRRGIPYGFSHGAWPNATEQLAGFMQGITPVVRWSAYTLAKGPVIALLDRGLTGREINGNTPIVFLLNTTDKYSGYANTWLSGKGKHHLQYALVATEDNWYRAKIPHIAWEYNTPPIVVKGTDTSFSQSIVETSDNVIVQAMRREGYDIEIRMVECLGRAGQAMIAVYLPHREAFLTNMLGDQPNSLTGGPMYRFAIRPQQIITLRLRTKEPVPAPRTLTDWAPLVPKHKRPALKEYLPDVKGHPPRG